MYAFKRDPALFISLGATTVRLFAAFIVDLNADQQALLNAVIAAVAGVAICVIVRDGLPAAILGLVQALLALAIGFGLHVDPDNQALIMSGVGTAMAMFVRTQVIAPAPVRLH